MSCTVTASRSPGWAPSTHTGPVIGFSGAVRRARSRTCSISAYAASSVSKETRSPEPARTRTWGSCSVEKPVVAWSLDRWCVVGSGIGVLPARRGVLLADADAACER